MNHYLHLHSSKIVSLTLLLVAILAANSWFADLKAYDDITWIDIFGEGSILGFMLIFLFFILTSRPRGKVTTCISIGLMAFSLATFQDVLDEIFRLPQNFWFDDLIESIIAPIAVLIISYGLRLWFEEQSAINDGFRCRERFYREHSALDYVTQLYTASYMKDHIEQEILNHQSKHRPFAVLMVDISGFHSFNHLYGEVNGDRLLQQVAHLLTLNLRPNDLACRYAGDRFIVLFPGTHRIDAQVYAQEIVNAVESLAFKPVDSGRSVFNSCHWAMTDHRDGNDPDSLIKQLNRRLEAHKSTSEIATRSAA